MEQVLINLLGNAVKFTPSGGSVHVGFERRVGALGGPAGETREPAGGREEAALPTWVLVHVRDTGVGIPPEAQERVFEPFVQLEARPDADGRGDRAWGSPSHDASRGSWTAT